MLFWLQSTLTRVVAQKIIQDTGTEPNISITQEELDTAMDSEPEIPMPVMEQHTIEELGMNISYPYLWNLEDVSEEGILLICYILDMRTIIFGICLSCGLICLHQKVDWICRL